jgi:mannosyltransferase
MATAEATRERPLWAARRALRLPARIPRRLAIAIGLLLLVGISVLIRAHDLGVHYWIDEGLSVGISGHAFSSIPHVLKQDGSPPLYYMALHLWIQAFGTNENHTHLLSQLTAVLTIPIAMWSCWSIFGERAGWVGAGLFALDPFLTSYANETRMYAFVVLFPLVSTAAWIRVYVHGQRRFLPLFVIALTALLYTHNWGFFFAAGTIGALGVVIPRRESWKRLITDFALGYVPVAILFAPWVPTLIFQSKHTGAPWAEAPSFSLFSQSPDVLLGGSATKTALLFGAGAGMVALLRHRRSHHEKLSRDATSVATLVAISVITVLSAWVFSQISPAWANRYLAVALAPLLLLAAAGLAHARAIGVVSLVLVTLSWIGAGPPTVKSNTAFVVKDLRHLISPGDVVYSTQPEEVPLLSVYLPKDLQYVTPLGPVKDLGVTDWINALNRFQDSDPVTQLDGIIKRLKPGTRIFFFRPIFNSPPNWKAPWTALIMDRSWESRAILLHEVHEHALTAGRQYGGVIPDKIGPNPVRAEVFTRT